MAASLTVASAYSEDWVIIIAWAVFTLLLLSHAVATCCQRRARASFREHTTDFAVCASPAAWGLLLFTLGPSVAHELWAAFGRSAKAAIAIHISLNLSLLLASGFALLPIALRRQGRVSVCRRSIAALQAAALLAFAATVWHVTDIPRISCRSTPTATLLEQALAELKWADEAQATTGSGGVVWAKAQPGAPAFLVWRSEAGRGALEFRSCFFLDHPPWSNGKKCMPFNANGVAIANNQLLVRLCSGEVLAVDIDRGTLCPMPR